VNKINAVNGALIADAAAMGLHWMYDQDHLNLIAQTGEVLFRQPDAALYSGKKSYFAHPDKRGGEFSQYGEATQMIAALALSPAGFSIPGYHEEFLSRFGPCGSYRGFADRPTKALVACLLYHGDKLPAKTGSDDSQMPAFEFVPGLFAAGVDRSELPAIVQSLTINETAVSGAQVLLHCLEAIESGSSLQDGMVSSIAVANAELAPVLRTALEAREGIYDVQAVAQQFGMPCHVIQGLPVAYSILANTSDFTSALRHNVMAGGDCCGRALAIGAIAGLVYGVPDEMAVRVKALL